MNSAAVAPTWMPGGRRVKGIRLNGDELQGPLLGHPRAAEAAQAFEVRWTVNARERSESFITKGLAESRRAKLMTAARDGEAFDEQTGLPASEMRAIRQRTT
ncbi:hypothetical protein ACODT5_21750 [Streptomyces sp. 5.8]|uniref:hypothetical protein n=1 Tax=Streptomyces sp. 5.8 TaxID=3406571 RepID=UPI003BB783B6